MGLAREEQALGETPGEIGLQRRDGVAVDLLELRGALAEAPELAAVAARGEHERAVADDAIGMPLPPVGGLLPKPDDGLLGALALAPGREHAARAPGAGLRPGESAALMERDARAARQQLRRAGEADDARADDVDMGRPAAAAGGVSGLAVRGQLCHAVPMLPGRQRP